MWGGRRYTFEVLLTGDGKLMLIGDPGEKGCVCGRVGSMVPSGFLRPFANGALV